MKILFYTFSLLFLLSCGNEQTKNEDQTAMSIKRLHWLVGEWKIVTGNIVTIEIWRVANENLMSGQSFMIQGSDTVFREEITLQQSGEKLFYIPTVSGQNNSMPVTFTFKEYRDGEYIFENLEHDFPQRIIYKQPQPDMLCARIEGEVEGKLKKEDFNFIKVK